MNLENYVIKGCRTMPLVIDAAWSDNSENMPVVIFCHGYKGYKDWGAWKLVSQRFVDAGFLFIRFNFSHNGGSAEQPVDFPDLETFSENNYSIELDDLGLVIDWAQTSEKLPESRIKQKVFLIGHSRGGGIAILGASRYDGIKAVSTWAAVSDFGSRFPTGPELVKWKSEGVIYVANARTNQQMPHKYQWYEDYQANQGTLNILTNAETLDQPVLIIHGTEDEAVSVNEAYALKKTIKNSSLELIAGQGHTFGAKQPWESQTLPSGLAEVVDLTIRFFKS